MSEQYTRELLRLAVAQICQTIGYNAAQSSSLEILQDLLHRFLNEFARDLRRQVEHDNRTAVCLEDVKLTFSSLNISVHELLDYIGNVEPVPFVVEVPKFPVEKPSNFNFLKPGSKEVLSRPVHIFEHLPPMLPPDTHAYANENNSSALQNKALVAFGAVGGADGELLNSDDVKSSVNTLSKMKTEPVPVPVLVPTGKPIPVVTGAALRTNESGRPTREIMSVVMTTGGFISPAIEGKLPESGIPSIVDKYFGLDAPPPPTPPPPPLLESALKLDAHIKTEKNVEAKMKQSIVKDISESTLKKNNLAVDTNTKEILNKMGRNGKTEKDVSPKTNPFKSNIKKSPFTQSNQAQQQPLVALKLLKKAKKKGIGLNTNPNDGITSNLDDLIASSSEKISEKARRKKFKMLQKMLKNAQKHQDGGSFDSKKDTKKMKTFSNINILNEMPMGIERLRMEKMLKKQAKHKQKQLKKQLSLETQNKIFGESSTPKAAQVCAVATGDKELLEANQQQTKQQTELITPKVEKNFDTNQATNVTTTSSQQLFINTMPGKVNCFPVGENLSAETPTNIFTPTEKVSALEIKLSNEPDRNKLNIFKKISKAQKGSQQHTLQPQQQQSMPSNSFTGSGGQIINLPSGTTITPAPLVFNPPGNLTDQKNIIAGPTESGAFDLTVAAAQPELINKPKKRGRKPGSKNQPKLLPPNVPPFNQEPVLNSSLLKKQKKKIPNLALPHHSHPNPLDAAMNIPKFDAAVLGQMPSHMLATQNASKAQRKERKEVDIGKGIKPETDSNINVNLPGMPFNPLHMIYNTNVDKNMSSQQKSRKRPAQQQQKNSNSTPAMLPAFLSGSQIPAGFPPHLSTNMLSMLPFAFPPRPGLIPAPGLFPSSASGLPNFPSNLSNSASTSTGKASGLLGLGSQFFPPFPTIKPEIGPATNQNQGTDFSIKERSSETLPPIHPYQNDRSYCNVAPLVPPESMKQVVETNAGNLENSLALASGKHQQKVLGSVGKQPEDKAKDMHKIPGAPAPFIPNIKLDTAFGAQCTDNSVLSLSGIKMQNEKLLPTGGADDPIEVSDDSDELVSQEDTARSNFNTANTAVTPNNDTLGNFPIFQDSKESTKIAKKIKKVQKNPKKFLKLSENESSGSIEVFAEKSIHPNINSSGNDGFSKLAGGADLIPLSGTGLAYSARSIPSTSLTAASKQLESTINEYSGETERKFNDVSIIPSIQRKKTKEHKKLRKLKEGGDSGKIKKKKDKKIKTKDKELLQFGIGMGQETYLEKGQGSDKEALKKLKKERKKQKQRLLALPSEPHLEALDHRPLSSVQFPMQMDLNKTSESSLAAQKLCPSPLPDSSSIPTLVPKLTLKICSSSQPPTPTPTPEPTKADENIIQAKMTPNVKREPSPELAKFSPLVTRPPKQKLSQNDSQMNFFMNSSSESKSLSTLNVKPIENVSDLPPQPQPVIPPPSPWLLGGTLTASSVLLPQQLMTSALSAKPKSDQVLQQHSPKIESSSNASSSVSRNIQNSTANSPKSPVSLIAESNRPSSYVDAEGNTVWICPACGKVDDGSPMIGCDGCDAWYHWECVGICVAPNDNEDWFCRVCITRKKGFQSSGDGAEKKRKRNKKK